MKIDIVSIAKKEKSIYDPLYKDLMKMISRFAKIEDIELFPKDVAKSHTISPEASKQAYTKVLDPYLGSDYSITLHPDGKLIDSFDFSKLLNDRMSVKFFIGGAYGFEDAFLKKSDTVISLGNITMSHKIAKAVLLEQIYRGFSILSNHPYHK
ncbi:MAG TPA: 23S rRNA (pseudouridine(1915)-N(3))-methyltransferase RlmH [Sulfurimonas sp. UBA12504]|nr:MAG: 23S rRNA (pseudouridine(1915)-N(3))-methyltransferase RlmH [Sulfurimonas sp. GWF2_37_8]DAB29353.1 MAG TPA: 23S rRNA (pseudouridine(1915)-N(3))-methyltransferase RlmH [Sulfurimonas sp. UBA12504]